MKESSSNNFDFLRLVFASFVVVTHSYVLSGSLEKDWLATISSGQTDFSDFGVSGFFIISGYLIFKSLKRSKNIVEYFGKRFLRLFPGLFIVLVLTVFFGAIIHWSDLGNYLKERSVLNYVPKNLTLFKPQFGLSDLFKNNPFPSTVNGSLWTLSYEFAMYTLISLLFLVKDSTKVLRGGVLLIFVVFSIMSIWFPRHSANDDFILNWSYLTHLGTFFLSGSLLAALEIEKWKSSFKWVFFIVSVFILFSWLFGYYGQVQYLFLPLTVISFGLMSTKFIDQIASKWGDLSYGIYIYSFPIQQTLVFYFAINSRELMLYSFIISLVFAYCSWHLIEKRALSLKRIL